LVLKLKEEKVKMGLDSVDVDKWIATSLALLPQNKCKFFVAIDSSKNEVIGFSNLVKSNKKEILGCFEIGIAVAKEYRRKGIATLLLQKILEGAKELKIKEVYAAYVRKDNLASISFFIKNGFKKVDENEKYFIFKKVI
jgi:ribosomal protein S18 acetylase RimI-like enzyme